MALKVVTVVLEELAILLLTERLPVQGCKILLRQLQVEVVAQHQNLLGVEL
jgi:hypothetical protein